MKGCAEAKETAELIVKKEKVIEQMERVRSWAQAVVELILNVNHLNLRD